MAILIKLKQWAAKNANAPIESDKYADFPCAREKFIGISVKRNNNDFRFPLDFLTFHLNANVCQMSGIG